MADSLLSYYVCSTCPLTRYKRYVPGALAIIFFALAILLVPTIHPLLPSVHATTRTISLAGYYPSGWNDTSPVINVTQGDTVTINLLIGDGAPHRFWLDLDGDGITDQSDCSSTADPCSAQYTTTPPPSVTFTANSVGSYKFYCTVHYPYMQGTFNVLAPTTPNFAITPNPASLAFVQGSSSSSTITLTSQNGFSGTINLSARVSPTGPSASLNPTSVTISSGASQTSTLSVNSTASTPAGSYTITVTGTNGTLSHTTTVSVTINAPASQDFSLSSNPSSLSVGQGSTGTATITLTSDNGFSGTITVSGSVSPIGPTVMFSSTSVTISGGSATSTMTVSTVGGLYNSVANGNYMINVTGTTGSLAHSIIVQVTVGSSNSTPAGLSNLPTTVLIGAAVVIIAAVAVTVFLVRRRTK